MNIIDIEKDRKKLNTTNTINKAIVVDVQEGKGVKIRCYGEEQAHDIYYNSLQKVEVGDKVHFINDSGTVLIIGKLQY